MSLTLPFNKPFTLLVLPYQFHLLDLGKTYEVEKIYNRLKELNAVESWVNLNVLLDCIKEYEQQELGFKLSEDEKFLTVVNAVKWNERNLLIN